MHRLLSKIHRFYLHLTGTIAFYPSVIVLLFLLLSLAFMYLGNSSYAAAIYKLIPAYLITNAENARLILGTLAASTLSLTVFSFSMVMIVLNQASANLTPRVLPGLIGAKAHQVVLGFYIGTSVFILLLILNFRTRDDNVIIPVLGVLVAMAMGIGCLVLFVYFIHSISRSIQVEYILTSIFKKTLKQLQKDEQLRLVYPYEAMPKGLQHALQENDKKCTLLSPAQGYLHEIDVALLAVWAKHHQALVELLAIEGDFVRKGAPLLKVWNMTHIPENTVNELYSAFDLRFEELDIKEYEYGFMQISQIAVKALSPGVNDPGTAEKALEFLTMLLVCKIGAVGRHFACDDEGTIRVLAKDLSVELLLTRYIDPIRRYAVNDVTVSLCLLSGFRSMLFADQRVGMHTPTLMNHIKATLQGLQRSIEIPLDRQLITQGLLEINNLLPEEKHLQLNGAEVQQRT